MVRIAKVDHADDAHAHRPGVPKDAPWPVVLVLGLDLVPKSGASVSESARAAFGFQLFQCVFIIIYDCFANVQCIIVDYGYIVIWYTL